MLGVECDGVTCCDEGAGGCYEDDVEESREGLGSRLGRVDAW